MFCSKKTSKIIGGVSSPAITPKLRKKMGNAAIAAAKSIRYEGAGTVGF